MSKKWDRIREQLRDDGLLDEDFELVKEDTCTYDDFEIRLDDEDVPEGCQACGGPYPDCQSSCSLFDD